MELAMVDDVIMGIDEASVPAGDRCVYFGDGVYEVVARCSGMLFAMTAHMARLERSLGELDMLDRVDLGVLCERIEGCVGETDLDDARVYWQVTRREGKRKHDYSDNWQPGFLLTVTKRGSIRRDPATAITQPDLRWKRCDIKSLNLLANVMAMHAATKAGAAEAILVDEHGLITEGTCSSALIVKDGVLRVPPLSANILPSVTRALLLEWAQEAGLEKCEESFTVAEALAADELMVVGSTYGVGAITHLDSKQIGNGQQGAYTKCLAEMLTEAMATGRR
jgi:D-alanine transaminase